MASFPLFQFPEDIVFEFTRHLPPRDLKAFLFTSKTSLRIGRPALHILPLDKLRRALEWTVAMERTDATLEFLRYNSRLLARNPDLGSGPLYSACRADNVSLVRDLLNVGVPPNAPAIKHHEYPPLAMAVIQNRVEVVRLLMAAGGTLKSCNFAENYSVLCTGKGERLNMAQILIKHGFDIHQLDENGNSFIHHACTKPAPGMDTIFNIQLLLDLGLDINQTNHDGETPMALAVKSRLLKVTEFLLGQGADPNIGMNDGHSPLHAAFSNQQDPDNLVKALLSGGALISEPSMPEFVRDAWVSDWSHSLATLLSVWKLQVASAPCSDPDLMFCAAATVGDIPLLQDLLQRGQADPNCEIEKRTALVSAARAAKDDVIEFLIPHVSNFDNTSWRGGTALHCAIRDGTDETIHLLLPHTKRIVTTNQGRLAPLFDAVRYRSVDIVCLLLEKMLSREQTRTALASKEVDLRETSDIFYRPGKVIPCALACAVWEQKLEVTRLLLQQTEYLGPQRADPSFLCTAMEKGYDDIAVELVKWGIALPRPDGNDRTPLIVAVDSGLTGMVQALIDRGVDLEARGRFHDTALTVAVQKNSVQAVVSLLAAGAYPYRRMHFKNHEELNQAMRNSELCHYSPGSLNIFFHAVRHGYTEIVRALMPLFDVNEAEPYFGRTVLHIAVDRSWVDTVRVLLGNKKIDVHCTDVFECTPLDVALDSYFTYPQDVIAGLSGNN